MVERSMPGHVRVLAVALLLTACKGEKPAPAPSAPVPSGSQPAGSGEPAPPPAAASAEPAPAPAAPAQPAHCPKIAPPIDQLCGPGSNLVPKLDPKSDCITGYECKAAGAVPAMP
jgi:hypothetical protein